LAALVFEEFLEKTTGHHWMSLHIFWLCFFIFQPL